MILTDTHTHLYSEQFSEDQEAVIQAALAEKIERFFIPAIDSTYADAMYALEEKYPNNVFLMMGLHPTHVNADYKKELAFVKQEFEKRNFYAVGEIGMDLYWDRTYIEEQKEAFKIQIQLAKEKELPIVIHCRDAFDEIFEVLEEEKDEKLRGIFHCFTGDVHQAKQAISYNMKLGIGGVVTFKNGKIDQFLNEIDLSHIVLETDAPYLAPTPYRGKRNESKYLIEVAERVAHIYGKSLEEIAEITTRNSKEVFSI